MVYTSIILSVGALFPLRQSRRMETFIEELTSWSPRQYFLDSGSFSNHLEGVYPQSDQSLAIVDIDASKGIIDLWVHFFVAIEDIHRN